MGARTVLAAGGVVWRRADGGLEVAIAHRPRYDDWSLPKGKLDEGETLLETAVREVREEIGANVAVSRRLRTVDYVVDGAPKRVTYWTMRHDSGTFEPNDEVDALEWLPVDLARKRLDYDVDREVLREFAAVPVPNAVVALVRHAKAGKRTAWRGADALRPLDPNGVRQADRLATLLAAFAPQRILSAGRVRCVATVTPLAAALGQTVVIDPAFEDESYDDDPEATEQALLALAAPGTSTVVSSQGLTIPGLVERFSPHVTSAHTRKGAWWVLSVADGAVVAVDPYDAP